MISVFQITISPSHGGLSKGYLLICDIMKHGRELLELLSSDPGIKASYFLVCPDDGSQHQWNMPVDRDENAMVNDHSGKAYYIRILPEYLKVHHIYSLQTAAQQNHGCI